MIYKQFQNDRISALGLGCMRLPVLENDNTRIDEDKVAEMIAYAFRHGINYFDTAYGYHGKNSELVMGKVLKNYPRDSFYLATKFPSYDVSFFGREEEIFAEQLGKLQTDYVDFYLMHNVNERNIASYTNEKFRTVEYFKEQKAAGRIRHLGFSCHGLYDCLETFLKAHGRDMEFCQLQLNWLDWDLQACKRKVELVRSYGIPVITMEPLRGGKLVDLPESVTEKLKEAAPDRSTVEWAFRFVQSVPDVMVILSGMSNMEQLKDNCRIFETDEPLNETERELLFKIGQELTGNGTLPCTACRYCTTYCPMELNIPAIITEYNGTKFGEVSWLTRMYFQMLPKEKWPTSCIGCGSCSAVCPQQIDIPAMMAEFGPFVESLFEVKA